MDGTQDMSEKEQEAVCVRYVDHDLIVHEEFVGMHEVNESPFFRILRKQRAGQPSISGPCVQQGGLYVQVPFVHC